MFEARLWANIAAVTVVSTLTFSCYQLKDRVRQSDSKNFDQKPIVQGSQRSNWEKQVHPLRAPALSDSFAQGKYGQQGVRDCATRPAGRVKHGVAADSKGRVWMFGGMTTGPSSSDTANASAQYKNDLWMFDGTCWTWISGSRLARQPGSYDAHDAHPGARVGHLMLMDQDDNFYVVGGWGRDGTQWGFRGQGRRPYVYLNDVWKFDTTTQKWSLLHGDSIGQSKGIAVPLAKKPDTITPGHRTFSTGWVDSNNHLWAFGGSSGAEQLHNDVWKFNTTSQTWSHIHGAEKNRATSERAPGARIKTVSWQTTDGVYLYGGWGYDNQGELGTLEDLWKWNGHAFELVSLKNAPGKTMAPVTWTDADGQLWLFGGNNLGNMGYAPTSALWNYSPETNQWKLQSVQSQNNEPFSRYMAKATQNTKGHVFVFGGASVNQLQKTLLNDLWKWEPAQDVLAGN